MGLLEGPFIVKCFSFVSYNFTADNSLLLQFYNLLDEKLNCPILFFPELPLPLHEKSLCCTQSPFELLRHGTL